MCQWCSQPYGDTLPHTFTEKFEDTAYLVPGSGADCQSVKRYYYDCANCNAISDTKIFDSASKGNRTHTWVVDQYPTEEPGQGAVCVLTFAVKSFAKFTETEISCTVSVKNGSEPVGEFTATGKIVLDCQHTYDQWQDMGNLGHSRTCSLCDGQQTQSHEWNDGDPIPNSENPHEQTILYTCQVCKGTKSQVQNTDNQAFPPKQEQENTVPTSPGTQWDPTEQETTPGRPNTDPTQPGNTQDPPQQDPEYQQGQQGGQNQQSQDEYAGHDHAQDSTIPQNILDDLLQQGQDAHAGHDHDYADTSSATRPATGIAVLAVLAVLIGGMVYFVKKKH